MESGGDGIGSLLGAENPGRDFAARSDPIMSRGQANMSEWHYLKDGRQSGPVSVSELRTLVAEGKLTPNDFVWRDGMTEWKPLGSIKGLMKDAPEPRREGGGPEQAAEAAKKLWNRAGNLAERVGRIASDAVAPGGFDEYAQITGGPSQPGIFLQSEFFGGRTRIGASISSLDTLGARIGVAAFSWFYLLMFLRSLSSAWEFLPFTRTEFVRITLEQKIMWRRISPAFVAWLLTILVFNVLAIIAVVFASGIRNVLGETLGGLALWLAPMLFFGGYVIANLFAWKLLVGLDDDGLHRSRIVLEYGFPSKYRLLSGLSDAPIKNQIDGVLRLCEAISRTQFSPWEQLSTHGGQDGLISGIYNRVGRLVRP